MTYNLSFIRTVICLIFCICSSFYLVKCEILVTGRCGRPGLPPEASLYQVSPERSRFDNNERVFVICKKNDFPHHKQIRICKNGRWTGKKARCGKVLDAQVIKFEIEECESSNNNLLLSQSINQTNETDHPLPPNSFHSLRVSEDVILSANDSTCYLWRIKFDRTVQITFLIVDIYMAVTNITEVPNLVPIVSKYRDCELQHYKQQHLDSEIETFGYYYFCDLKSDGDWKKELNEFSDTISVRINTSIAREIGLNAVIIGDIYTTVLGASKIVKPDCGELEIERPGINMQNELGHTNIRCNDSFWDHWQNPAKRYKFVCNSNGQWVGEWPVCVPIVTCSQDEIIRDKDPSIAIEEIGNVYYLNSSQWYAVNQSWVRYTCQRDSDIMVGKDLRTCLKNGKWSNKGPYCIAAATTTTTTTGLSGLSIAGIMFTALITFALIVFFVFRLYSKRVKKELTQTRNEIEETARKRFSDEYYADVRESNLYQHDIDFRQRSITYETVDYETVDDMPKYQNEPNRVPSNNPEYLDVLAVS